MQHLVKEVLEYNSFFFKESMLPIVLGVWTTQEGNAGSVAVTSAVVRMNQENKLCVTSATWLSIFGVLALPSKKFHKLMNGT